jgi:hypothetical protein
LDILKKIFAAEKKPELVTDPAVIPPRTREERLLMLILYHTVHDDSSRTNIHIKIAKQLARAGFTEAEIADLFSE